MRKMLRNLDYSLQLNIAVVNQSISAIQLHKTFSFEKKKIKNSINETCAEEVKLNF